MTGHAFSGGLLAGYWCFEHRPNLIMTPSLEPLPDVAVTMHRNRTPINGLTECPLSVPSSPTMYSSSAPRSISSRGREAISSQGREAISWSSPMPIAKISAYRLNRSSPCVATLILCASTLPCATCWDVGVVWLFTACHFCN
jgi:hypothetical protein